MSKVGGALPAWYWPEGIPRRSPVPNQTLDRLIKRGSGRNADAPAIVSPDGTLSYAELLETITAYGQAIVDLVSDHETVAVAEREPGASLVLTISALTAGKRVVLCDLTTPPATLNQRLAECGAGAVLTAGNSAEAAAIGDFTVLTRDQLAAFDGERNKLRPTKATLPSLIIAADGEMAMHSQYSLAAMGVSFAAFIPDLKNMALVSPPPLWSWESLAATTLALTNGAPVYTAGLDEIAATADLDLANSYSMLMRDQADEMAGQKHAPAALNKLGHLFVSTAYFDAHWRRALEHSCGREVLPVWGTPELGPAVAAHPTWFPFEAHGIPLVNVRVVPVDPGSGEPSVVPWEMLERAEIGVDSPAAMVGFVREGADADLRSGKILRTFVDASVDHVGVVVLHRPPKNKQKQATGGAAA